ncbi:MAG: AMIN domain-containing protein [Gammaproteobacteria bacterium]|nr:AMIN domain-containing protein [Gammaproteobacteria bacterium]NIR28448.1 AMIN domain-containing protein [Gammaproteobacteria bacterium]NIR96894.1 AMIN domain-containing protein [Gammaproteobacteria bacterium]NIT62595.1 AMIN domain-containing protein [Gammaproteobacteria bacterium]NIV19552.1 AMIN domain-containing protein [Gammaproteobacteria bacterium]
MHRLISVAGLWAVANTVSAVEHPILGVGIQGHEAVVHVQGPVDYHAFTLEGPPRLVVDLRSAYMGAEPLSMDAAGGPVRRVRTARRGVHDWRVVFDLRRKMRYEAKVAPGGGGRQRLIIAFPLADASRGSDDDSRDARLMPPSEHVRRCGNPPTGEQFVIAVDAGHGGVDVGAVGPQGIREKDIALQIARRLHRLIARAPHMHSVLTRNSDKLLALRERYRIAEQCDAGLLVSVHADSLSVESVAGASVYVHPPRRGRQSLMLATASLGLMPERLRSVSDVAMDPGVEHMVSVADVASRTAGARILSALGEHTLLLRGYLMQRPFTVLSSDVPSVLVETGFLSNPREERQLAQAEHQEALARAIYGGIDAYVDGYRRAQERARQRLYLAATATSVKALAERYGVRAARLQELNGIDAGRVGPGTVVRIPHMQRKFRLMPAGLQ